MKTSGFPRVGAILSMLVGGVFLGASAGEPALEARAVDPLEFSVPTWSAASAGKGPGAVVRPAGDFDKKAERWIALPEESTRAVEIVGCRNGAFNGEVVVSSSTPIKGLKVAAGDLKDPKGEGVMAASCIQFRYELLDGGRRARPAPGAGFFHDGLEETPSDEGTIQAVWLTVRVPRDAKPGDYEGKVTFSAEGLAPVSVTVKVKVLGWVLADSREFASHMGFMQSPDTVALKYKVPMWSEEHWKLMERSFALLGQVGCDEVYIPAICKTHLGNEHGMIRWIKQDDGSYQYDYSIAERYLDLALKHLGKPPVVCLYVWEYNTGYGWHAPENDPKVNKKQEESATISILDPKTGALSHGPAPFWGAPESKAFWKPVLDGMREILKKRGLEKSLMLGLAGDARPPRIAETDFKEIAPDVKWALHSHPYQEKLWTQPLGLGAFVWGAKVLKPPDATELKCGWKGTKSGMIYCDFRRGGLTPGSPSVPVRTCMEASIASGMNGLSRMGADFWEVNVGGRHPMILTNRYGVQPGAIDLGTCGAPSWFSPGKNGPISGRSFELLREGIQECEGRIFIEKILTNPALSPKLGAELEKSCREMLAERVNMILGKPLATPADWHRASEKLFALAGEVATKVGAQPPAKEGDKP